MTSPISHPTAGTAQGLISIADRLAGFVEATRSFVDSATAELVNAPSLILMVNTYGAAREIWAAWNMLRFSTAWASDPALRTEVSGLCTLYKIFERVLPRFGIHGVQAQQDGEFALFLQVDEGFDSDLGSLFEELSNINADQLPNAIPRSVQVGEIAAIQSALRLIKLAPHGTMNPLAQPAPTGSPPPVVRDFATEERDRYIYEEIKAGTPYGKIISVVCQKASRGWEPINSIQGIKRAGERFAKRHNLPAPPRRNPGRPTQKK